MPLTRLTKLEVLWLQGNQITDVSPLKGLTNLTQLKLRENQINDISPLAGLTNLKELGLWRNQFTATEKADLKKALPNCDIKFDSP